ncbi:MAG: NAD(P)H-dependent oxidoreductase subunit E [Candidatus Bipolaricaulaceae bacterium]
MRENKGFPELEELLISWPREPRALIPLLQAVQEKLGYVPQEALERAAHHLKAPLSQVYGVATFYAQFKLTPRGGWHIKVCLGTACHVKGGMEIVEQIQRKFGLHPGEIAKNPKASLEIVRCLGCCSLAPVMVLENKIFGRLTPEKALQLIEEFYEQS